ncbi:MAG: hypothetical protein ABFD69_12485 [Candidatus Sumerlaeia bacterium]
MNLFFRMLKPLTAHSRYPFIFALALLLLPGRPWAQDAMAPPPDMAGAEAGVEPVIDEEEENGQSGAPVQPNPTSRLGQNAIIQYDQESGQVVVIADEETNEYIKQVIEHLDRPIPQVLIKVLFLEVTHSDDLDLGVQASYKDVSGDRTQSILSNFGLASETNGGIYQLVDTDIELLIRAIAEKNKLEVLSRPSVMARNNQLATITVGQTIPYVTSSRVTDSGQTINNISWRDIGIILRVTPHITPEGMVEMEISPEISKLTSETVAITDTVGANVIDVRSADTQVVVQNGKTVVIGGMMEDAKTEKVTKIPLLGDIPMLGALFRRTESKTVKTELLIFLTPQIIQRSNEARTVSLDERNRAGMIDEAFTSKQKEKFLVNLDEKSDNTPKPAVPAEAATVKQPSAAKVVTTPAAPERRKRAKK